MATKSADKARRKFKFERRHGSHRDESGGRRARSRRHPLVPGRRTRDHRGASRVEPAGAAGRPGDGNDLWVISQHGRRAGWAYNIAANPNVRVRMDNQWRTGTAIFEPDDDVRARARSFGGDGKLSQSATALTMRAMESDPISVRITFD